MKIPEGMFERLKEIIRRGDAALSRGALKTRPIARQHRQRGQPALRMIYRTRAANAPGFGWQNQSLQLIAMRPPAVPQAAARIRVPIFYMCRDRASPGNRLRRRAMLRSPRTFSRNNRSGKRCARSVNGSLFSL